MFICRITVDNSNGVKELDRQRNNGYSFPPITNVYYDNGDAQICHLFCSQSTLGGRT